MQKRRSYDLDLIYIKLEEYIHRISIVRSGRNDKKIIITVLTDEQGRKEKFRKFGPQKGKKSIAKIQCYGKVMDITERKLISPKRWRKLKRRSPRKEGVRDLYYD